jgi:Uma2 family endonuclease
MLETGVLAEDEPVELLDGELLVVSPQGPVHAVLVGWLPELLARAAGPGCHVRAQLPLVAGPRSLPEPDACLVRGARRDYLAQHPSGEDVALVVEIAVTALAEARRKLPVYAQAGVPVVWILDVPARRLEIYEAPAGERYGALRVAVADDEVEIPGTRARLRVAELLP